MGAERQVDSQLSGSEPYQPTSDECTLAVAAHISIFLSCLGIFIAGVTWLYVQDKMPYAAFQAAQAVIYQLTMLVVGILVTITLVVTAMFLTLITLFLTPHAGDISFGLMTSLFSVITGVPLAAFILLIHTYAAFAGYQSYRGRPFWMPGLGWIANGLSPMPPVQSQGRTA